MDIKVIDAIETLKDRFVPRFEVYVAKAPRGAAQRVSEVILEPEDATRRELHRLDASVFKAGGNPGTPQPRLSQLVPLAGPWGEKQGQHTDDILSVSFVEDVSNEMRFDEVTLEVLNTYDSFRKFYRYTDIPAHLDADQAGVFPLLDYGDTIAVRFGYGADLSWVFEGMIERLTMNFPAGGESRVTVTAVDRRARLRNLKVVPRSSFNQMSDAQILAAIASGVGLRVAAPPELAKAPSNTSSTTSASAAPPQTNKNSAVTGTGTNAPVFANVSSGFSFSASGGAFGQVNSVGNVQAELTTTGASASSTIKVAADVNRDLVRRRDPEPRNNWKPADQDAIAYITDRLKKASLELRCFGNTLYVLKPADVAATALRYVYRQGLSSFNPEFVGGKATQVRVVSRDVPNGKTVEATVGPEDLRKEGLIPASDLLSVLEKIASVSQAGEKVEVVSDYPVASKDEARRVALGILKRNADETLQASGSVVGDPRIRARTTLKVEGVGRFDGFYYVTRADHTFDANGYQTSFHARRTTALAEAGSAGIGKPTNFTSTLVEGLGSVVKIGIG